MTEKKIHPYVARTVVGPRKHHDRVRDGHTHDWDKQSLGVIEAAALRKAWAPAARGFVTENSDVPDPDPSNDQWT